MQLLRRAYALDGKATPDGVFGRLRAVRSWGAQLSRSESGRFRIRRPDGWSAATWATWATGEACLGAHTAAIITLLEQMT